MKIKCTKRAWIRDAAAPVGKPALGRINCPCGNAPLTAFNAEQDSIICDCGIEYTWNGYVIEPPASPYTLCGWCGRTYAEGRPLVCEGCKGNAFLHVVLA